MSALTAAGPTLRASVPQATHPPACSCEVLGNLQELEYLPQRSAVKLYRNNVQFKKKKKISTVLGTG